MVTHQHGDTTAIWRCLTVLSRLFSANPLFTIEAMGLSLALRLQKNLDVYLKTGAFPGGTIPAKELTRVLNPTFPDGSRTEPSGRGYFNGEFNGLDVTVKDSKRFAATNGWGFFNFGHHPLPYAESAKEASAAECAGCHISFVAKTDMTWVQFYPMLRDGDKTK
jgi:Cytochrome P460